MSIISRLLPGAPPQFTGASPRDAAAIAALHAASFRRGWGEDEVYRLLIDSTVVTHRAMIGRTLVGFIMSRLAVDEAEILSVAIAPTRRGRGLSRSLLDFHLGTLAGRAIRAVFLEVDEQNAPARRLYARAGFREVGRRQGYYEDGATALVLRRDLD
jgi:[ribosomal protein S18]-alanine N-acetyltransferase